MDIHPRVSVNPMTTVSLPLEGAIEVWRDLGVGHVGLDVLQLEASGWGPQHRADAGQRAPRRVPQLRHPVRGSPTTGWKATEPVLQRAVETAAALGAPTFYFCSGPPGALRWEDAVADLLGHRLVRVLSDARSAGVAITLENAVSSRPELGFLHSVRDTIAAARHIGADVCVDVYGCWVEPHLVSTLEDNLDLVRLVQFSDFVIGTLVQPNRWVPGDGDLPLPTLKRGQLPEAQRALWSRCPGWCAAASSSATAASASSSRTRRARSAPTPL